MRRPAVAHVIFRVDFEEADVRPLGENRVEMFGLQADARTVRQQRGDARSGLGFGTGFSPIEVSIRSFFAPGPTHVTRRGLAVRPEFFRRRPPAA